MRYMYVCTETACLYNNCSVKVGLLRRGPLTLTSKSQVLPLYVTSVFIPIPSTLTCLQCICSFSFSYWSQYLVSNGSFHMSNFTIPRNTFCLVDHRKQAQTFGWKTVIILSLHRCTLHLKKFTNIR